MPEQIGDPGQECPWPVTAEEVNDMFHQASKEGPWPDIETCGAVAAFLSAHMDGAPKSERESELERWIGPVISPGPATFEEQKRRKDAISIIQKPLAAMRAAIAEPGQAYDDEHLSILEDLDRALKRAKPLLLGGERIKVQPWFVRAVVIVQIAKGVLEQAGRNSPFRSGASVVMQFTALAVKRMDGEGPTPEAISIAYNRWMERLQGRPPDL